jgi:hypothetical protein
MERKYYDLSPAQRLLNISQKYTVHKQVNNLCTSVLLDKELDFDILRKAVVKVYGRMDSLRLRVVKVGKEMKQYFAELEEPYIKYLDFSGKSLENMENKLYKIAHKRVTVFGKSMSKVYLIRSYDGKCGIYFVVSHMILDSWGITNFYKDVLQVYEALVKGTDMPKPLAPYEPLLIRDINYRTTEAYKKDQEFWKSFLGAEEPIFTHVNGSSMLEKYRKKKKNPNLRYAVAVTLFTKNKNAMLLLPKELVEKMEAYCSANKLPMQSLVLLGLRSYFSKVNKREKDVMIHSAVARRGTLAEKNTCGTVVHAFPFRTIIDENMTFESACEIISERQLSMYRHSNIDYEEVMSIWHGLYTTPPLGEYTTALLTYQPVKQVSPSGEQLYTKWYGNGALGISLYLTVMDGDGTGSLKFYYEYQTHRISFETIQNLHSYLMRLFETGTANPDITIGELLNL